LAVCYIVYTIKCLFANPKQENWQGVDQAHFCGICTHRKRPHQRLVIGNDLESFLDKSLWKELALALEIYFHSDAKLKKLSLFALPSELLEENIKQCTTMNEPKKRQTKRR